MEGPSRSRPRSSQRTLSKSRLDPHCSVFPDSLHPPIPQPPTLNSLLPPTRLRHSQFEFFLSHYTRKTTDHIDPSFATPIGALNDYHLTDQDSWLGAWYAFLKGFQSENGSRVFADQKCNRKFRALCSVRNHEHVQPNHGHDLGSSDSHDQFREVSGKHLRGSRNEHGYTVSEMESDRPCRGAEENRCEDHSDSEDSDDASDQHVRSFRARQGLVDSVSQKTSSSAEDIQGDITAEQAANGLDVQGIPWENLPFSREDYRANRMRESSRNDSSEFAEGLRAVLKEPRRGARFFDFFKNTRRVRCSIVHFQLRNLAWATSKHDVFVMHEGAVLHWDAAAKSKKQVLDLSGSETSDASGLGIVQISTMIAKNDLVIAGGFYGEVVAKNLKNGVIIHNKRITYDDNAITNAIDVFDTTVMTSNNDCHVRCFDTSTFERKSCFSFDRPVNHATRQPGGKLVVVAGDGNPIQVIDGDNGDRVAHLHGHGHYSFATGWHPNGRVFATGSQDGTCRVWDVRNMSQSFSVLGAHIGPVRSLRFSSCGRFLVMAEPRDFVHIFDVNRGEFDHCQEIDLFGEIAGIALTPAAEGLFIAVCDRIYSSLIEYERRSVPASSNIVF